MTETGQKMSKEQQSPIGVDWVCTTPGTVVYSSGSVSIVPLAEQLGLSVLAGTPSDCFINQITIDSREVQSGSLFIALSGSIRDGHDFIDQAVESNCSAILVEKGRVSREAYEDTGICVFETDNSRESYGVLAEILFEYPARQMTMFGVTGTNGKTSVSYLLESVLRESDKQPGVLGTINYRYYDSTGELICIPSSFTTPEPLLLQETLRRMANSGVDSVIMEISSHGLEQNRMGTLDFDVAAFTNLSRDHLDYHLDMESYFAAKTLLFSHHLLDDGKAVITFSGEDHIWSKRLQNLCTKNGVAILSCGEPEKSDIYPLSVTGNLRKTDITFQTPEGPCSFSSPLVGDFNVANLQTTCAMAMTSGISTAVICKALSTAAGAPGRMQQVAASSSELSFRPAVFVDYAHTPDALEQILKTVKALPHRDLYCVFGCGGERDAGKRPLMGAVAGNYSDLVILTDDNPRSEDSGTILDEVAHGLTIPAHKPSWLDLRKSDERGFVIIPDRHQAIAAAISSAGADDIVLIAGKGHEDYQLTSKGRKYFDDSLEAAEALSNWKLQSLLQATDGELIGDFDLGKSLGSINTDSRTIQQDDAFVALKGERFDAHDYAEQVAAAGAGCLILEREPETPLSAPVVLVKETLQALGDLAHYRRSNMKEISTPKVIGITGSSGKTTVKEMCAAIFSEQWPEQTDAPSGRVLKTGGNFNNRIGLPLSLLPVSPRHRAVILEMGMNVPGEIARLTEIADPDIACIVNVHGAHLQGLGNIEGVARAKGELFQGCGPETVLVVNGDDPRVMNIAEGCTQRKLFYGVISDNSQSLDVSAPFGMTANQENVAFMLHVKGKEQQVVLQVPGVHNVSNALAAAAIASAAGIDIGIIAKGLSVFRPTDRRMQILDGPAGSRVINDTYNANPESMKAGIATLSEVGSGTHVAVLGDMLELGPDSEALHGEIGASVADYGIDFLGVLGDFAASTATGAIEQGMDKERVHVFGKKDECLLWMKELVSSGDIRSGTYILVKGSRGMHLENFVERFIGEQ
jgi:MurE/MurF fusion protein